MWFSSASLLSWPELSLPSFLAKVNSGSILYVVLSEGGGREEGGLQYFHTLLPYILDKCEGCAASAPNFGDLSNIELHKFYDKRMNQQSDCF
jgi:hypothetical protein